MLNDLRGTYTRSHDGDVLVVIAKVNKNYIAARLRQESKTDNPLWEIVDIDEYGQFGPNDYLGDYNKVSNGFSCKKIVRSTPLDMQSFTEGLAKTGSMRVHDLKDQFDVLQIGKEYVDLYNNRTKQMHRVAYEGIMNYYFVNVEPCSTKVERWV